MTGSAGFLIRVGRGLDSALFRTGDRAFLGFLCCAFLLLTAKISTSVFGGIPHIQDTEAQYVHAKIFARGSITAPSHPIPQFFQMPLMMNRDGEWYSQFPPGHTALLALGHLAHAPWLVNPVLGSLAILAIYFLARETHGLRAARIAALLTLLCPFVVFMSSEYMNHASALLFTTLFVLFFVRSIRRGGVINALAAGAALGMAFIIRPYTAFGMSIPFALVGLVLLWRAPRRNLRIFAPLIAVFLAFAALQAGFNYRTNGDPFLYGYQVRYGEHHRPGFIEMPTMFMSGRHTFLRGVEQTADNLVALNRHLFEWPLSSLIFIAVELLYLARNRWSTLFLASFLSLGGAYLFYFYQDLCFGPRFLYEASGLLIILTASGMLRVARLLGGTAAFARSSAAGLGAVGLVVIALYSISAAALLPARVGRFSSDYWGVDGRFHVRLEKRPLQNALVLITGFYRNVSFNNPPSDGDRVIYARSFGDEDWRLMDHYADRWVYLERGGELRMIRGPGNPLQETIRPR
ncbi:glycosyltransferase family 39 protein [bacterium]|nr:glycosyltransferase family 39 protein [bacterium]